LAMASGELQPDGRRMATERTLADVAPESRPRREWSLCRRERPRISVRVHRIPGRCVPRNAKHYDGSRAIEEDVEVTNLLRLDGASSATGRASAVTEDVRTLKWTTR
jgi:hypothetical protein